MARTGRPKAIHPKSVNYSVRLDEITEQRLKDYCQEKGISGSEAVREGIDLVLKRAKRQKK